ncbi:MAG: cofactor-independent phosphoglycerate mutase [bacterium]|nr:cofactor-independent phosphoglycerate mutase [bacterium]
MKYIVLVGDGMADRPLESLGGKTPLQVAKKPHLDFLAQHGLVGLVKTIPDGTPPGSDIANLSILGYDPRKYYTGRAPLEAASRNIQIHPNQTAFRCNLVTIQNGVMVDYSSGHISTEEAKSLIDSLAQKLNSSEIQFYSGVSYRHLTIITGEFTKLNCTPPHDITNQPIAGFLPNGQNSELIRDLMQKSEPILANHPVNRARINAGKNPATTIWLWGQGKPPQLPTFQEKYQLTGGVITAVDLIKGLGKYAGLVAPDIPGATGYLDTNYAGKVEAARKILERSDFVLVHIEAPDECGHQGRSDLKIKAIEDFDERIVGPMLDFAYQFPEFRLLVLPDHATPICIQTHSEEPVPFVLYTSPEIPTATAQAFDEFNAASTKIYVENGFELLDILTEK